MPKVYKKRLQKVVAALAAGKTTIKKAKPRGRPFSKTNPPPKPFKKGEAANPTGKNGRTGLLSEGYKLLLNEIATPELLKLINRADWIPLAKTREMTFAELFSVAMGNAVLDGNHSAAKEIREVTEGRLPETLNLAGKLDYDAGKSAKDDICDKLGIPIEGTGQAAEPETSEQGGSGEDDATERESSVGEET